MNEYEINRFFGTIILKSGRRFNLEDFVLAWSESVPKGKSVSISQIHITACFSSVFSSSAFLSFKLHLALG